jgi:hypothetical protein
LLPLFIGSNTSLIFGNNVFLKKVGAFTYVLLNKGALTKTYDEHITIEGLQIIVNGMTRRCAIYARYSSDFRLKESLIGGTGENVTRAKEALTKHIGKLVLTPATRDGCPVYKVTGNLTLPESDKCRLQMVARDGIGT